jgi:hypothetical protein
VAYTKHIMWRDALMASKRCKRSVSAEHSIPMKRRSWSTKTSESDN